MTTTAIAMFALLPLLLNEPTVEEILLHAWLTRYACTSHKMHVNENALVPETACTLKWLYSPLP